MLDAGKHAGQELAGGRRAGQRGPRPTATGDGAIAKARAARPGAATLLANTASDESGRLFRRDEH